MQRAPLKKVCNKQSAKPTQRKIPKSPKVTKRTITTQRSTKRCLQQQPQRQHKASIKSTNSPIPMVATPFIPMKETATGNPAFSTIMSLRAFGGHAAAPSPVAKFDYNGVQTEKYGKQKIEPSLFESNTPTFKKAFGTIDIEGKTLSSRPKNQELSAEEFCNRFGIVLVDRDVAHCEGTTDGPHPQEFIQVNTSTPTVPQVCKYCGTRFLMKSAFDGSFVPFEPEH